MEDVHVPWTADALLSIACILTNSDQRSKADL
jgi:hypothetical protein